MDDPAYQELYVNYVEATVTGAVEPARVTATYQALHELITLYVLGDGGQPQDPQLEAAGAFEASLTSLIDQVKAHYMAAMEYVSSESAA